MYAFFSSEKMREKLRRSSIQIKYKLSRPILSLTLRSRQFSLPSLVSGEGGVTNTFLQKPT